MRALLPLTQETVTTLAPSSMSVLLVEAHALVRAALRTLIAATDGLAVVAEADTLTDAAVLARRHRPDVVLLDARTLAAQDSADLGLIREAAPDACILALTDDSLLCPAVPPAVHGCLPTGASIGDLCATVAALLGPRCANCRLRASCPVPQLAAALSRRERQVAVRVAEGMSSKQIAATLGIRVRTVNTYRESLARKLGASSPAVITRFVLTTGLTDGAAPARPSDRG